MAHGRVSVVLGVQAGLGAIIEICKSQKGQGDSALAAYGNAGMGGDPNRARLTDTEIIAVLGQLAQLDVFIRREGIQVLWSAIGGSPQLELSLLTNVLGMNMDRSEFISVDEVSTLDLDAIIYIPLDVQQPKKVEQLARLSLIAPRIKHMAMSAAPKWNHSQLMALRETWAWMDPRQPKQVMTFAEDLIRMNGGITQSDIDRIGLPQPKEETAEPAIITRSHRMKEILAVVDAVADTDSTILISGDSGTGKELVAQRIHARCHRRDQPIVAVNCGAIPDDLLESELFGHVKGAFTGAVNNREGRFAAAEGGTLFLDEIGELGANLQVKLLRVLQTRSYEPVGSTKTKSANVRIVAATNRDLEIEVREGRFREDLFYRLNVIPIHIPNLSERCEDIELLVNHFIKKFNREKSRRVTGVTRAGLRALVAYAWPGNIRELENLLERMVILKSSGMIDVLDFPEKYRRVTLSEIEFEDLMSASRQGIPQVAPQAPQLKSQVMAATNVAINGGTGAIAAGPASYGVGTSMAGQNNTNPFAINQIGKQSSGDFGDNLGEEGMIKNFGGTFTKQSIGQSTEQMDGQSQDQTLDQAAHEVQPGGEEFIAGQGQMTVEQAIRLMADRVAFPNEGLDFNSIVDQFENILILGALERTGWNRNRAAGLLRLNRTTLVEKLKKKQLLPPLRYSNHPIEGNA